MSSIDDMIAHPAYREIIGMGSAAIPLLLDELETEPNHWFPALMAISGGQNPVPPADTGNMEEMTQAWLEWGRAASYRWLMFDSVKFPNLQREGHTPRSPKSKKYNCIAWAAEDNARWWWPTIPYYWPLGVPRANTLEAFVQAFESLGFIACDDSECLAPHFEPGITRIALYLLNGIPKHAARQINNKIWSSKMGSNMDIEHTLNALEGPEYGRVKKILRR
jgi:hypothetical protein